jgi:formate C-acetyltransferase
VISLQRFQYDPALSLFMDGCSENSRDVSHGGAAYHDAGITSVALGNAVNALLNIKELVFERREFTLMEVKQMLISNYCGYEGLPARLKARENAYGADNTETIALTNEIIKFVTEQTIDFRNYLGGRLKFGLSAPSYVDFAKGFPASFDGRVNDEPFVVHISNEKANSYTAIINFAGELDYSGNRFNGNVVDLMATPSFVAENRLKLIGFILSAIQVGFFQLQMNVVNSDTLIAAKKNPVDFPNLIVRVWGFSAYMIDLPEDYQDVLIARALENEKVKQGRRFTARALENWSE